MKLTDPRTASLKKFTNYKNLGYKYKVVRVPALKDQVQSKKIKNTKAPCVNELSIMMDCWKLHDFNESLCSKEIANFTNCVDEAEKQQGKKAMGGRIRPSKEVNEMLAKFPQPPTNLNIK